METLRRIWKTKELRNSLLYILFILVIFRLAAHITVPGIDPSGISGLLDSNQFLGLLNVFSGGTLRRFSVVALGLAPYITASIIVQLLGMMFPQIEEMQKEEQGRQKLNRWTRYATIPLALFQGYGLIAIFQQGGTGLGTAAAGLTGFTLVTALISMMAGTIFLMWLGELISERNIGNGVSIIILGGIVAGFPQFIQSTLATYSSDQLFNVILFAVLTIVTIVAVVVISEGQRNIPVQYARGMQNLGGRMTSHLPLRVSMVGMIPIIFAISIMTFPPLIAQFFAGARTQALQDASTFVLQLFGNNLFYGILYFLLVFGFTFFYASIVFQPENVAENLQKQGGFIPGIRPGEQTSRYLNWVKNRILLAGATFLALIAILPLIVQEVTGSQNLVVGGSSVIIVVSVIIDMVKQIEAQLTMREYDVK